MLLQALGKEPGYKLLGYRLTPKEYDLIMLYLCEHKPITLTKSLLFFVLGWSEEKIKKETRFLK